MQDGYDIGYLTNAVGGGREGYYTDAAAAGEPPGLWYGAGAELLGLAGEVDAEAMKAIYAQVRDPRDPSGNDTLGKPWRQYKSAEQRYTELLAGSPGASAEEREQLWQQAQRGTHHAKAFYDATFSPAKSVSVLGVAFERQADLARAAGNVEAAQHWATMHKAVEDAVMAGARASMDYLQDKAGYSRVGRNGKEWVDAHQFVVAQFLQHDSRDRDPQLHVHQAILNKVQCPDGQWRSIDNSLLWEWKAAAAAVGERTMEAYLAETVGVRFETRPDGFTREILGVPPELCDEFSSRSHAIDPRTEELVQGYREKYGREPNAITRYDLAQQATLETRAGKSHNGESHFERAARWAEQAQQRRDGGLDAVAAEALAAGKTKAPAARWEMRDVIERAVARLSEAQQSWTESDAMLAVSNELPGHLGIRPEEMRPLLEGLTAATVEAAHRLSAPVPDVPQDARLANGASNMTRPSPARYASGDTLAMEAALRNAASGRTGVALSRAEASRLADRFAESGHELGADQRAAFIGVLTSGADLETISAAAGTGKSFLTGAIADAWQTATKGRAFAMSSQEVATEILRDEGLTARNVAAWLATQRRLDEGRGVEGDGVFRLRPGDLVVVDEAAMADTPDLAEVNRRCEAAGAKRLLVADPYQGASIQAGGMFNDLARTGVNHGLAEVRRFDAQWEREASLRLRTGDSTVLADYDRHGRLRDGGTAQQTRRKATEAWLADTLAGKEALLLARSNAEADKACADLRAELVRLGKVEQEGAWLGRQGTTAGVGDLVQARRNAWDLKGWQGNTAAPINWQTYRVTGLRADGGLSVTDTKTGHPLELPAEYVAKDVRLAYAATVRSAQGRTVQTVHGLVQPGMSASDLYVTLSRGTESNTAWVQTAQVPEGAGPDAAPKTEPRSPQTVLADILETAQPQLSATAEQEMRTEQARSVAEHGEQLISKAQQFTASRVDTTLDRLVATDALSERDRVALAADDSRWSLDRLLRTAELAGHDLEQTLTAAVTERDFTGARHPAEVLHSRIEGALRGQLTPTVATAADLIPRSGLSEEWQAWFAREADAVDDRRRELGARLAEQAPEWLTQRLGAVPEDDPLARADWEHRAGWAGAARELLGHDDDVDALGQAPRPGLVDKRAVWDNAAEALRMPDHGPDEEAASDGLLRARYRAYEREKAWAPANVDGPLAATHAALVDARRTATLAAARAEVATDPAEAQALRDAAAAAGSDAAALAEQVEGLELAADIRGAWVADTAVTKETAFRARAVLNSRGVNLDDPEAQTTAQQWLDTARADQAAEDAHRDIREDYELAEEATEALPVAGTATETAVADIRDTAVPDPAEEESPAERRRVLAVDETAAAVERARESLAELAARQDYEQSPAARQAAEAQRSEELARWAADDRAAEAQQAAEEALVVGA